MSLGRDRAAAVNSLTRLGPAALALYCLALTALCFWRWAPSTWFGDDLNGYHWFLTGNFPNSPLQALSVDFAEKYRPIYALVSEGLFSLFGPHLARYILLNMLVNALCGVILAKIAYGLSGNSRLIAVLAATMAVMSRFLLYQVAQVNGLLEGLGYLFFLFMVAATTGLHTESGANNARTQKLAASAVAAEWLLIFTHERYLAVTPWLVIMLWAAPGFRRLLVRERAAIVIGALGAPALNLFWKGAVLRMSLFVGTGGTHLQLDSASIGTHVRQAALSLLGFNDGPAFLIGRALTNRPSGLGLIAASFVCLLTTLAVLGLVAARRRATGPARVTWLIPAGYVCLALLILGPPVLTIRLEQRWLVEPFALLIMTAAWFAGQIACGRRRLAILLVSGLAITSALLDLSLNRCFSDVFFVSSRQAAESVRKILISAPDAPGATGILAPPDICDWVLLKGYFFTFYAPSKRVVCLTQLDQIGPAFLNVKGPVKLYLSKGEPALKDVSEGAPASADTLTDLREFERWAEKRDVRRQALGTEVTAGSDIATVLNGFDRRLGNTELRAGDRLTLDAVELFATQRPAHAIVRLDSPGRSTHILRDAPLPPHATNRTASVSVPLADAPSGATLSLGLSPERGDAALHWVAVLRPRIVKTGAP